MQIWNKSVLKRDTSVITSDIYESRKNMFAVQIVQLNHEFLVRYFISLTQLASI